MSEPRFDQTGWQARDVYNIVLNAAEFASAPRARSYLRLLAVLATPLSNARGDGPPIGRPLDVGGEWERLHEAASRARDPVAGQGVPWAMVRLAPPVEDALGRALAARDPGYQALHVSAHGTPAGLLLEDEQGREALLPTARLIELLSDSGVQLVVLNACDSAAIGQALVDRAGVACVIATRSQIYEPEAALLSDRLYGYLAAGRPVGAALNQAQRAIEAGIAAGSLAVPGAPRERADNLALFGDPTLRLKLDKGLEPAREPWFIRNPVPHNRSFEYRALQGFVGRVKQLQQLAEWFGQRDRLVCTLSGVGGMGKTSLALNAALRNAWRFRALAFASAKGGAASWGVNEVLQALNEALDTASDARDADNPPGAVAQRLNSNRVLLILDNLETLAPERTADLARSLRAVDPRNGSRVLITMRPREHDLLADLVDRRDRFELTGLDDAAALRLVWDECQRQAAVTPPPAAPTAEELVRLEALRRTAGIPATIGRAALAPYDELARLAFQHPYLTRLAARLAAEEGWPMVRMRLERFQGRGVEEALDDMLGRMLDGLLARAPGSLDVLHALLAFPSGALEPHLRAVVTGGADASEQAAIEFRGRLLKPAEDAGLISRRGERYDLDPPVVRAYIERRRAPTLDVLNGYRLRQAEALLPVVQGYNQAIRAGHMTLTSPLEWANVSAGMEWLSAAVPHNDDAARLLLAHWNAASNILHNNYDPRLSGWLNSALLAARQLGDRLGEANVLMAIGDMQQFRTEIDAALDSYRQALALFRMVGDQRGEVTVLRTIGDVHLSRYEWDAALAIYSQALRLYRVVGDLLGEANIQQALGDVQQFQGEHGEALVSYKAALALYQVVGSQLGEANMQKAIGDVQQFQGEHGEALVSYKAALALYQVVGSQLGEANVLQVIGDVQQFRDERDAALASYGAALALYHVVGDQLGEANVLRAIGGVQQFRKEMDAALQSYARSLALYQVVGSKLGEANVLLAIGDVQQFRDDRDAALESYDAALALYRVVGDRLGEANVLAAQSRLLIDSEPEHSVLLLGSANEQYTAFGAFYHIGLALCNYGIALIARARAADALPYLRRARALFVQTNAEQYVAMTDGLIAQAEGQASDATGDAQG